MGDRLITNVILYLKKQITVKRLILNGIMWSPIQTTTTVQCPHAIDNIS